MSDEKTSFINKQSNLLAEVYQLLGRLEFDYEEYKHELIPYMDVLNDILHDAEKYFDDNEQDLADKWLERKLKLYTKKLEKELKK